MRSASPASYSASSLSCSESSTVHGTERWSRSSTASAITSVYLSGKAVIALGKSSVDLAVVLGHQSAKVTRNIHKNISHRGSSVKDRSSGFSEVQVEKFEVCQLQRDWLHYIKIIKIDRLDGGVPIDSPNTIGCPSDEKNHNPHQQPGLNLQMSVCEFLSLFSPARLALECPSRVDTWANHPQGAVELWVQSAHLVVKEWINGQCDADLVTEIFVNLLMLSRSNLLPRQSQMRALLSLHRLFLALRDASLPVAHVWTRLTRRFESLPFAETEQIFFSVFQTLARLPANDSDESQDLRLLQPNTPNPNRAVFLSTIQVVTSLARASDSLRRVFLEVGVVDLLFIYIAHVSPLRHNWHFQQYLNSTIGSSSRMGSSRKHFLAVVGRRGLDATLGWDPLRVKDELSAPKVIAEGLRVFLKPEMFALVRHKDEDVETMVFAG